MMFSSIDWGIGNCITRCLWGCLLSIICGFFVFPHTLTFFKKKKIGQIERGKDIVKDLAKLHASKAGTPTIGGIAILLSVIIPILIFAKLNFYVLTVLVVSLYLGFLGFVDDFFKIFKHSIWGIKGKHKLLYEAVLTGVVLYCMYHKYGSDIRLMLRPILNIETINWFLLVLIGVFMFFVLAGTCNAVNLTDGLDGLATVTILPNFAFFTILAIFSGSECMIDSPKINFLPGIEELAVVFSCVIGSLLVFLWYNSWPSSIMMGDTGALMLGGLLGIGALLLMQPFFLLLTGIIFVVEALSDIVQVASYKLRGGKRVFLMAPIHHHFELSGISEQKIVARAGLISIGSFILSLAVLISC